MSCFVHPPPKGEENDSRLTLPNPSVLCGLPAVDDFFSGVFLVLLV